MFIRFVKAIGGGHGGEAEATIQSPLALEPPAIPAASAFPGRFGVIARSRALVSWFSNRCVVLWEPPLDAENDVLSFLTDDTVLRHRVKTLPA